jgi:ABC-type transport system involved in multi-copper enzyme maturation permease subunit
VSILFLSVFVVVGLACSVLARSPVISAVVFMLNWTFLVFVVPNLGGFLAGLIDTAPSPLEFAERSAAIDSRYPLRAGVGPLEYAEVQLKREKAHELLVIEYVNSLLHQVDLGRDITRISPASVHSYAVDAIAGVGTTRLSRFIDNVVRYREGLFQAALEADRNDPESEHRYVPWNCGSSNFSRRSVVLGNAKEFYDSAPSGLDGLAAAAWDILLLCFYNLMVFSVAFWRFITTDVAPMPGV